MAFPAFSRRDILKAGLVSASSLLTFGSVGAEASTTRPARWARPVLLDGAPNLHRVTSTFYRSAQPTRKGFVNLQGQLGVRRVISLRAFNDDAALVTGKKLSLERIPVHTWHIEDEEVIAALRTLQRSQSTGPVLLHCLHGADRTGLVSALFRVTVQGWSKADALAEMRQGGFGYHAIWGNIPRYIEAVDIAALKVAIAA